MTYTVVVAKVVTVDVEVVIVEVFGNWNPLSDEAAVLAAKDVGIVGKELVEGVVAAVDTAPIVKPVYELQILFEMRNAK